MAQAPMDMEYTAQNLEYAVSVFYNGEQSERAQAHSWLTTAQRVPNAWQFVWELLQPNKGTEIQFYAATTLHTKVLRCWHELPPESYEELKQKLLEAILAYAHGPKIVTNRLCISLAAFILQQGAMDLASILAPLSSAENMALLLEVLTVIPEEFNSMTMGTSLRTKNRTALSQACPRVLEDMMHHLKSAFDDYTTEGPSESTVKSWLRAVNCCGSWLSLGDDADLTGSYLPNRLPLIRALLRIVRLLVQHNECVSGTALDCCEACLAAVRAAGTNGDAAKHPNAGGELMADLVELAAPIMARDNVPNSINEELVSALITCLVCFTECHCALIVAGAVAEPPTAARELVRLLLAAQQAPGHYPLHETRSNLVFGVWYTLQDEIVQGIEHMPPPHPLWHNVFTQLLTILIVKSEAHDDDDLTKDDQEMLRCYRQDVADTAMYCFFMVGDTCWSTIEAAYESATTDARREAALHCLLAVSDAAPTNRAPPSLISMLQRAVCACATHTDVRMLTTALDAVGSYASWMSCEAVASTARGAALAREAMLAAGAALARAPRPAALALRRLCADCSAPAAHLVQDIVRAAQSPACQSDTWVRRQLLGACGAALVGADPSVAAPLLLELCQTLHVDLQRQIADPLRVTGVAECATALLMALGSSPELAVRVLRVVMEAMPAFAVHAQLVEPMFNVINQILCTLDVRAHGLMTDMIRLVLAGLQRMPTAAGLDVVKLLVIMSDSQWEQGGPLLRGAVTAAGPVVGRGEGSSVDVTEGLFKLLHTVSRKRPVYLDAIHDLLPQLVELACECVRMWEMGAARAACSWLSILCEARPAVLRPLAPQLTVAALRCIGGGSPRNQLEPLSELLLALNKASWRDGAGAGAGEGALATWLRQALAVAGFPSPYATDHHKHKFIAAVIKEKSNKRRIMESVQEFSLACRGLIGTEYARQTIASKQLVA